MRKLAGLMSYKHDERKPQVGALSELVRLSDCVCVLNEGTIDPPDFKRSISTDPKWDNVEMLYVEKATDTWNDYANRLTLMARASNYNCDWFMWLDDDETLESGITSEIIAQQIAMAEELGAVGVSWKVREMWDQTHYRSDGIWAKKQIILLQKNPFYSKSISFKGSPDDLLHKQPVQEGPIAVSNLQLLHWNMSTPELRYARWEKYKKLDPACKFQSKFGYDYLIDETNLELTSITSTQDLSIKLKVN